MLALAFFLLRDGPQLSGRLYRIRGPDQEERLRRVGTDIYHSVSGYVAGNFAISVIAGLVAYIALTVLDAAFAAPLAVIVGVFDLLPLVGATIAAVIVGIVTLFYSFPTDTIVWAIVVIVYQQIENNVLSPIVYRRTVQVPGMLVLISFLIGATLGGVIGALLTIPAAAAVQIMVRDVWQQRRTQPTSAESDRGLAAQPRGRGSVTSASGEPRSGGRCRQDDDRTRRLVQERAPGCAQTDSSSPTPAARTDEKQIDLLGQLAQHLRRASRLDLEPGGNVAAAHRRELSLEHRNQLPSSDCLSLKHDLIGSQPAGGGVGHDAAEFERSVRRRRDRSAQLQGCHRFSASIKRNADPRQARVSGLAQTRRCDGQGTLKVRQQITHGFADRDLAARALGGGPDDEQITVLEADHMTQPPPDQRVGVDCDPGAGCQRIPRLRQRRPNLLVQRRPAQLPGQQAFIQWYLVNPNQHQLRTSRAGKQRPQSGRVATRRAAVDPCPDQSRSRPRVTRSGPPTAGMLPTGYAGWRCHAR